MTLPDDFRDFLRSLNARNVEFLVVGGHAVSFHGYPRFTHDVDVVVVPHLENAERRPPFEIPDEQPGPAVVPFVP